MEAGCHFGGVRGKGAALRAGRYSCSMVVSPTAPLRSFDFAQDRQLRSDIYRGLKPRPGKRSSETLGALIAAKASDPTHAQKPRMNGAPKSTSGPPAAGRHSSGGVICSPGPRRSAHRQCTSKGSRHDGSHPRSLRDLGHPHITLLTIQTWATRPARTTLDFRPRVYEKGCRK